MNVYRSRIFATLLSPEGATFDVLRTQPLTTSPHPERQQVKHTSTKGAQKLAVHLRSATSPRIAILLSPGEEPATQFRVKPLADWK